MNGRRAGGWAAVALPAACAVLSLGVAALVASDVAAEEPLGEWWAAFGAYAFGGGFFAGLATAAAALRPRRGAVPGSASDASRTASSSSAASESRSGVSGASMRIAAAVSRASSAS